MRIDLGGFAKGHAVDNGVALLRRHGIAHGLVAAAATATCSAIAAAAPGPSPCATRAARTRSWPCCRSSTARCPRRATTSATFDEGGVRHHHLLEPRTGQSPREVRSVTILADDGLTSEAMSKTVFVLGVERGLAFIERQPGVDAVVVDAQGTLHFSSGLSNAAA